MSYIFIYAIEIYLNLEKIRYLGMINVNWKTLKALIFDVDGTLYDQAKLRRIMFVQLLKYYAPRPGKMREILILYHFRAEREKMAGYRGGDLDSDQYDWCATKLNIPVEQVKDVIQRWIFDFPNPFLKRCIYPGVSALFKLLSDQGFKVVVYSDYPSAAKLKALDLSATFIISSTDSDINSLKPTGQGLQFIVKQMRVDVSECLYIGDRAELDGLCASAVGMPFIDISSHKPETFYLELIADLNKHTKYTA
jgi:FMN phosphatase YigB (HAD superfamily)